jgi:hypothetical protein
MIPPFADSGYLPPGIHPATLEEIDARFGQVSELRQAQMESVRWMIELARRAGVQRMILNGSFVTDIIEPNDVDCVLLAADNTADLDAEEELDAGLPFLAISLVGREEFDELVNVTYASGRDSVESGKRDDRGFLMALTSEQQVLNTRVKLARLEARYDALCNATNRMKECGISACARSNGLSINSRKKSPATRPISQFNQRISSSCA